MSMSLGAILGVCALSTTVIGLLPQVYKTYQTKSAKDLSSIMLANYLISSVLWIGYGLSVSDNTVIIANVFCGITSIISIMQKIYYDRVNRHA